MASSQTGKLLKFYTTGPWPMHSKPQQVTLVREFLFNISSYKNLVGVNLSLKTQMRPLKPTVKALSNSFPFSRN